MRPTLKAIIAILLCSTLLQACGFQLRWSDPQDQQLPFGELRLSGDNRYSDIGLEVHNLAERYRIAITDDAEWQLSISDEEKTLWQVTATQSEALKEYRLSLSADVKLTSDTMAYPAFTVKREAIFQDNEDQLASKANEQALIERELRQAIAQEIIRRVAFLIEHPEECECKHEASH